MQLMCEIELEAKYFCQWKMSKSLTLRERHRPFMEEMLKFEEKMVTYKILEILTKSS
jgi:hypothetical protein